MLAGNPALAAHVMMFVRAFGEWSAAVTSCFTERTRQAF
jgi:hypothetical protein